MVLVFTVLVGVGVWYAVTHFPRAELSPRADTITQGDSVSLAALPPLAVGACGLRCGERRWSVKTLSDTDRDKVRLEIQQETVEHLVALERPAFLPDDGRAPPVETSVFQVEARLLEVRAENDGDLHIIIQGLLDPNATMITEVPNPSCGGVCNSGLGEWYAAVRDEVARWEWSGAAANPVVVVTGVGFFDVEHGQSGAAVNNIELHPVLKLIIRR